MKLVKILRRLTGPRQHYIPVFARQATFLQQASEALSRMTETPDKARWKLYET